ncbi:MAG: hypothetical protein ACJ79S_11100 [Gemmatimonadaceae bacterium]
MSLGFGGQVLHLCSGDARVRFRVPESYAPFVVDGGRDGCVVRCDVGPLEPSPGPAVHSEPRAWELRRPPEGGEETFFCSGAPPGTPLWLLRFAPSFREARLTFRESETPGVIHVGRAATVLEYMTARLVARAGGLHLHASFAIAEGKAYVFVGHSGAGKSTIAEIAERCGARIPTDDRTILTFDGGVRAWGTPWNGSFARKTPESAPVRAVYLLQQAGADAVVPIPAARVVPELFTRLIHPRVSAEEVELSLEALERLAAALPVATLRFRRASSAFECARAWAP